MSKRDKASDATEFNRLKSVAGTIQDAWSVVQASNIPEPLHGVAFEQAVKLIVGGVQFGGSMLNPPETGARESVNRRAAAKAKGTGNTPDGGQQLYDDGEFFSRFMSESGVAEDRLRQVYFLKDGQPRIGVPKGKLGATEAQRNRTIATLVAGMRWYIEGVPSVTIAEVREAAVNVPYEVSRNLSKHLAGNTGTMLVGAKSDRAIRVQSGRFDEPFRTLIENLTSI